MIRGLMPLIRHFHETVRFLFHKAILRFKVQKVDDSYGDYLDLQLRRSLSKGGNQLPDRAKSFIDKISSTIILGKSNVLCVGCRNIEELNYLKNKGALSVIGIDLFSNNKDILVMDMHKMNFQEGSYDLIYSSHSLEHSLKPELVVKEMVRVVKKGGHIAIEVPVCFSAEGADIYDFQTFENLSTLFAGNIDHVLWSETGLSNSVRAVIKIIK